MVDMNTYEYKSYANTQPDVKPEIKPEEILKSQSIPKKIETPTEDFSKSFPDYLGIPERSNLIEAINFDLKRSPV